MDLRHADQAAAAEPRGPRAHRRRLAARWPRCWPQAAKTRFFAAWRAEEAALPLDVRRQRVHCVADRAAGRRLAAGAAAAHAADRPGASCR